MNRLRRFIFWGLSLAVLIGLGGASSPAMTSPTASPFAADDAASQAIPGSTILLPGVAIRSQAEASGPLTLERLRAQIACYRQPGSEVSLEVVERLSAIPHGMRPGRSLQSLKVRWQV